MRLSPLPHVNNPRRALRVRFALVLLMGVTVTGVFGYMLIEDMDPIDALYTTIVVLTTIGMRGQELTKAGEMFTVVLALAGLATVTYAAGYLARDLIAGELDILLGRRIMQRQLASLRDHVILCGYGRFGRIIAQEIKDNQWPLVIVEPDDERFARLCNDGFFGLQGDALEEAELTQAGAEHARCLISTIDSDANNVFLILSARRVNAELRLVVRAESDSAISKLKQVGADAVISPITLGAETIAQAALRPHVVDFINATTRARHERYQIEEIHVPEGSPFAGKSLSDLAFGRDHGVILVGVTGATEEESLFNPSASTVIKPDDILIVLGESDEVANIKAMAKDQSLSD